MTPKEKANSIVKKYWDEYIGFPDYRYTISVQCAIIAVELIMDESVFKEDTESVAYWESVKTELEKL